MIVIIKTNWNDLDVETTVAVGGGVQPRMRTSHRRLRRSCPRSCPLQDRQVRTTVSGLQHHHVTDLPSDFHSFCKLHLCSWSFVIHHHHHHHLLLIVAVLLFLHLLCPISTSMVLFLLFLLVLLVLLVLLALEIDQRFSEMLEGSQQSSAILLDSNNPWLINSYSWFSLFSCSCCVCSWFPPPPPRLVIMIVIMIALPKDLELFAIPIIHILLALHLTFHQYSSWDSCPGYHLDFGIYLSFC